MGKFFGGGGSSSVSTLAFSVPARSAKAFTSNAAGVVEPRMNHLPLSADDGSCIHLYTANSGIKYYNAAGVYAVNTTAALLCGGSSSSLTGFFYEDGTHAYFIGHIAGNDLRVGRINLATNALSSAVLGGTEFPAVMRINTSKPLNWQLRRIGNILHINAYGYTGTIDITTWGAWTASVFNWNVQNGVEVQDDTTYYTAVDQSFSINYLAVAVGYLWMQGYYEGRQFDLQIHNSDIVSGTGADNLKNIMSFGDGTEILHACWFSTTAFSGGRIRKRADFDAEIIRILKAGGFGNAY